MKQLKQRIKNFMYSRSAPEWLAAWYFGKKQAGNRAKLNSLLTNGGDLMQAVPAEQRPHWEARIQRVLNSADNAAIPRHEQAGTMQHGQLVMHNGLRIDPLSYYSFPLLKMLIENKGVHEPQEERIFAAALDQFAANKQLTMLELGAYWSFYSMWLLQRFPNARCFMVEPDRENLLFGKRNFALNNCSGTFIHAGIGSKKIRQANNTTVEAICHEHRIDFVDILHSDIQGFEQEMLEGARSLFEQKRIGYAFVSTHSNELHAGCRAFLQEFDFVEIASVTPDESSSWDGVLVARAPHYPGIDRVAVEKISEGRSQ